MKKVVLTAALTALSILCGCSAAEAPSSSLPPESEPAPVFSAEHLDVFDVVGFDKDSPGDFGYKVTLDNEEQILFAEIMQPDSWAAAVDLPEYGLSTVMLAADSSLDTILYVSDGADLGTVITVVSQNGGSREIFTAPAQIAEDARTFAEMMEHKYIKVKADPSRNAEQTIAAYFDALYRSYISMQDIDITELLDMQQKTNGNLITWLSMLNQRRRLLNENDLCYVETKAFPYEIVHDNVAEDDRMEFWQRRMEENYDAVYHFRIRGDEGNAYPPTFALNSQHSIFLKQTDDGWKIVRHYYPGAVRNFYRNDGLALLDDAELLTQLEAEFEFFVQPETPDIPTDSLHYNAAKAVDYALKYAEQPNPIYYNVGDWHGNCQNFVSQAVSSGFGYDGNPDPMTGKWFAGSGGGTSPWENCDYFWEQRINTLIPC